MNHNRRAAVTEQGMRAFAQRHVGILKRGIGFALRVDGDVLHVAGVMAFGILEPMFLALGIEMRAGGLEVGWITFGILMNVDSMLAGRKIVQFHLEADPGPLFRNQNRADAFALRILEFDLGLGGAWQRKNKQCNYRSSYREGNGFHAQIIANFKAGAQAAPKIHLIHRVVEYTAGKFQILSGKVAVMALDAVEQVTEQVPADDFQALEEKIYRTIEQYKAARQAQAAAERDAERMRAQLEEREEQLVALRREAVQLRKEREEIRGRVEKMLAQIDSIVEERAS